MPEQQQETLKVYELAKELGLDSFSLLDKLKQINIEVKSHMSSLEAAQVNSIREAIRGENKAKKSGATITKKKATASASATATEAPAAATKAGTTAKKVAKKAAAPAATETSKEKSSAKSPASRKIIKRRTGAEAEEATPSNVAAPQEINSPAEEEHFQAEEHAGVSEPVHMPEEVVAAEPVAEPDSPPAPQAATERSTTAPATTAAPSAPATPRPSLDQYQPKLNAPGTRAVIKNPTQRVIEKDELSSEFSSRRLKIVQAAPPPSPASSKDSESPTYRTPGGPSGGERTVKRPLPQKTVVAGTDMFQPMTSYVQKDTLEEARAKRGNSTRGPTAEEVRVADFRKRELVFQPKRKKLPPGKLVKRTEITEMAAHKKKIRMEDKITVSDLAQRLGEKANTIVTKLMAMGTMATINQTIDFDTASILATEFGWEVENVAFNEKAVFEAESAEDSENLEYRPPIITVMGHVDHGKTSLLDAIRNAKVADGEAGGITQHIGAYSVMVNEKPITFLDTPGHEAFANMRSRGANLTDIVVLVVAADDSIMPQTIEAIQHAQTAGVPMVVAVNKIDKPSANLEKVKKDLSANNVLVEEWGGEVPLVGVSALKKTGIEDLLATILVQAEVLDLKANPNRAAEGIVMEARMEKGRGVVADLLVQKGTLRSGDFLVVGTSYGRVKAMLNDLGKSIAEVKPGFPAEIFGLNDVPSSGDTFNVVATEAEAKEISENRRKKLLEEKAVALAPKTMSLEELMAKLPVPGLKELNLIIKADVYGSAEAIKDSIEKIKSEKVKSRVLHCNVGVITENDVLLAKAANALILGFNSKPDNKAREIAKREKVDIRFYSIIYQLLDDIRAAMENLLEPLRKESPMGKAEVKQVFTVSKLGTVAGSAILDGKVTRNAFARVLRGKEIVAEGKVVSLRRFKDDVSETIKGQECGIGVENFDKFLPGDIIHVFHVEFVKQSL